MSGRSLDQPLSPAIRKANRRLALMLFSVAAVFFVAIVLKRWMLG